MTILSNPLNDRQRKALNELISEITTEQLFWLHGFFEGRLSGLSGNLVAEPASFSATETIASLTVIYGSETGHSQELAEKLASKAGNKNIAAKVVSMYDYDFQNIRNEENLAIIVSTHGEGDPPDMAIDFYKFITGKQAPKLNKLSYSVLALGDKSYRNFCKTGEDIDVAIKSQGAFRITPMVKCDVDYEVSAEIWMNNLLVNIGPASGEGVVDNNQENAAVEYSKKNPFKATVLEKVKITGDESDKEVYHLELCIEDSGLTYEPGDSVGIYTKNPDSLVELILQKTGFDPEYQVTLETGEMSIKNALTHHLEITVLSFDTLEKYFETTQNSELENLLDDDQLLDDYLFGHDLLDLLEDFPFDWTPNQLVEILRQLPPRLYSIASSQDKVGDEIHVTVSVVRYERKNRLRNGACSSHLADNIEIDDQVPVYIDKNPSFKLPLNGSKIIMVGAGTGIAPYRAFLQQRENENKTGGTWLFFGDRRYKSDFLYRDDWQKWLETKHLEKMELAFSRDQKDKVYVQHKLIENQQEIYKWIEEGAYFYLCGDMKRMAKDVNKSLVEIIKNQGGVSIDQATDYVRNLKREKRFQQDIY
ncbi:MAG: assimilatory sulfite reductase (NADPH) flavoprotein subunit [Bacteroidetes bacterium]|nr:MAG: assimilatory sulfite reductase (NADPH) flavoprotein subunit [Bacteroidota bacterium]